MQLRLGLLAILCAGIALAGKPFRSGPEAIKWRDGLVQLEISRTVHPNEGDLGVTRQDSADQVYRAVFDAIHAWTETTLVRVQVELQFTDRTTIADGGNLITFTDPAPFDDGRCDRAAFVACTILRFDVATGEVLGVSVAFNPYKRHSATGVAGAHDIGLVMMHEMGHVLGLDHSAILDSVMSPEVELAPDESPRAEFAIRALATDDILTLALLYPGDSLTHLRGRVLGDNGALPGVHVIAVDRQGHAVAGALTDVLGSYEILVPAGEYRIAAEPLDGPVTPGQFYTLASAAPVFPTMFWGAANEWVGVESGAVRDALDFTVSGGTETNATSVGRIENGLYWGSARVHLAEQVRYDLAVTRAAPGDAAELSIAGAGWKFETASTSPSSAPQVLRRKVVAAVAPGSYVLSYGNDSGASLLPNGVRVVPQPKPASAEILDGRLVIRGTGLAASRQAAAESFPGAPLPVQLGGTSVRANGVFLGLHSAAPDEIVAAVPAEGITEVTIVTGTGIEAAVRIVK